MQLHIAHFFIAHLFIEQWQANRLPRSVCHRDVAAGIYRQLRSIGGLTQ